jgi:hypothetical protein
VPQYYYWDLKTQPQVHLPPDKERLNVRITKYSIIISHTSTEIPINQKKHKIYKKIYTIVTLSSSKFPNYFEHTRSQWGVVEKQPVDDKLAISNYRQ